jgi:hypothetical protein
MTAYMCLLPILGMTGALLHLSRSSFYFACVLQSYAVRMCVAKENPMDITYLFTFFKFQLLRTSYQKKYEREGNKR